jgi:hypothetical protein
MRVAFELAAQVLHVRVHDALVSGVLVPADPIHQVEARVDPPGRAGQRGEYSPLGRGQLNHRPPHHDLTAVLVYDKLTTAERAATRLGCAAAPPQDRLHPQDQLTWAERLGHVVIGADLQPMDTVLLGGLRGQHQDRHRADSAHLPGHLLARHVR